MDHNVLKEGLEIIAYYYGFENEEIVNKLYCKFHLKDFIFFHYYFLLFNAYVAILC
jgi:hypothetical protein